VLLTKAWQQFSPAAPHMFVPLVQLPVVQVPFCPPHAPVTVATHVPSAQHAPVSLHALFAQQAPFAAPQATDAPFAQTMFVPVESPDATHLFVESQQPPAEQAVAPVPVQQSVPGRPQTLHFPAEQVPPPVHGELSFTQRLLPSTSQQPDPQEPPAQQAWPAPPHGRQVLLSQTVFASEQLSPAQQASPAAPQGSQVAPLQMRSAEPHESPGQHASPAAPQWVHVVPPVAHTAFGAVQMLPGVQQFAFGAVSEPHDPHAPAAHVPPIGQSLPEAVQVPFTQQPPPEHVLLSQQGWPPPPHVAQSPPPPPWQTEPGSQTPPWQHAVPAAPQSRHTLPMQLPVVQEPPAQQPSPRPPHAGPPSGPFPPDLLPPHAIPANPDTSKSRSRSR
jgi:hypothetical protein